MCGIGGYMTSEGEPPETVLQSLITSLKHRGPDGTGRYSTPGLGLVQTRLAIIDLKTGDQPIYGPGGTALIANAEIYNYVELRRELSPAKFTTQSDCEMPLFTYARDGRAFAASLRGMHAIALHDPNVPVLYLSRDRFGIKPLYYAETAKGFLFASEPEALLKTGLVKREIRKDVATELLQLQFTAGRATIFAGIERALPGETLEVKAGRIAGRRILPALPKGPPREMSEDEALKQLDTVLMDSVAVHQRSDVPYGMFLSGGIDSSALLACMARLNTRPVRAFTAGFPGSKARDERAHAHRVAKTLGAEHIEISVSENDFWTHMPAIAAAMDDPAADYAILPTYLLGKEAAKGVKVVLSGEGGDELFAGYGRYRAALRPRLLGGRAMRARGFLDGLGILREASHWRDGIAAAEQAVRRHGWTKLQQAQAADCAEWLPNDLLIKLDRCLMAHGLEGRTPFLDSIVADFAFNLPDRLKLARGQGKYLLRRWLSSALPEADAFSKKRGFTVPVAEWIRGKARDLAPMVSATEGIKEICKGDAVRRLFEEYERGGGKRQGAACWQLLFYALWHRVHGEGRTSAGDVFATLDAR